MKISERGLFLITFKNSKKIILSPTLWPTCDIINVGDKSKRIGYFINGIKIIIIYRDREDCRIKFIEVAFYERDYQHLTGLELIDKDGNIIHNQSENFFRKCIENKLGIDEF